MVGLKKIFGKATVLLVLHGASVECQDKRGWTPLKEVLCYGHLDVVRFLINSGADLNTRNDQGTFWLNNAYLTVGCSCIMRYAILLYFYYVFYDSEPQCNAL